MQLAQKYLFTEHDPLLTLSEVEMALIQSRIFKSIPSRPTLIEYCEDGTLESKKFRERYFVYESSLVQFIRSFARPVKAAA